MLLTILSDQNYGNTFQNWQIAPKLIKQGGQDISSINYFLRLWIWSQCWMGITLNSTKNHWAVSEFCKVYSFQGSQPFTEYCVNVGAFHFHESPYVPMAIDGAVTWPKTLLHELPMGILYNVMNLWFFSWRTYVLWHALLSPCYHDLCFAYTDLKPISVQLQEQQERAAQQGWRMVIAEKFWITIIITEKIWSFACHCYKQVNSRKIHFSLSPT